MIHIKHITTPLGLMLAEAGADGISRLTFADKSTVEEIVVDSHEEVNPYLVQLQFELDNYFEKEIKTFTVNLNPAGTVFQKAVWQELSKIPYGETVSYLELARKLNAPEAIRAVANANAMNPIMILIPCHRVIGSNGKLTGYAGGLAAKSFLLELESEVHAHRQLKMEFEG